MLYCKTYIIIFDKLFDIQFEDFIDTLLFK